MAGKSKNTWGAKIKRTFTAVLPIAENRRGKCIGCGECCKLPNVCFFLKFKKDEKSYCSIYSIRPLNCKRYPRTESEWITEDACGFRFQVNCKGVNRANNLY